MTIPNVTSGYVSRWAVKGGSAPRDMSTGSERWHFEKDNVKRNKALLMGHGITGNRSNNLTLSRAGAYLVQGQRSVNPSYAFMAAWLPRILGTAASGTTYAVADTLLAFDSMTDLGAKVVRWNDCKVAKATLKFAPGLLDLQLDIMGLLAVETGNTFPTVSFGVTADYQQMAFHDSTFTLAAITSGTTAVRDGTITIDNHLVADYAANGNDYPSNLREEGRTVKLTLAAGMGATEWDQLYGTETAWDATIATVAPALSCSWALNNLLAPRETPVIDGKGEVKIGLEFTAHEDASRKEIVVTLDSTP